MTQKANSSVILLSNKPRKRLMQERNSHEDLLQALSGHEEKSNTRLGISGTLFYYCLYCLFSSWNMTLQETNLRRKQCPRRTITISVAISFKEAPRTLEHSIFGRESELKEKGPIICLAFLNADMACFLSNPK